jgi:glycosyltransferase involved in cell wall biosynthesis
MKKLVVSVSNDLVTDQRVHKTCTTLVNLGFDVLLIGRMKHDSLQLSPRSYRTHRMKLMAEKGVLFYLSFQLRLLIRLLRNPADVYLANDLDTLWPNRIVSRLRNKPLVYDTHEIFTEVPELVNRPFKQRIWRMLESRIFPRLNYVFTVNASIADWYEKQYGIKPQVVRNMPRKATTAPLQRTRKDVGLPEDKPIILLQGAGLNIQRGAEEAVLAMQYLDNVLLLVIGGGDVLPELQQFVRRYNLSEKIKFQPKMPLEELMEWTKLADIGLTLDKDTNLNYRYSLPNKLFDYIHAGLSVLCSDLPEVRKIVEQYQVGNIVHSHDPVDIAKNIQDMLQDKNQMQIWRANTKKAAEELNWENEELVLHRVYRQFLENES